MKEKEKKEDKLNSSHHTLFKTTIAEKEIKLKNNRYKNISDD